MKKKGYFIFYCAIIYVFTFVLYTNPVYAAGNAYGYRVFWPGCIIRSKYAYVEMKNQIGGHRLYVDNRGIKKRYYNYYLHVEGPAIIKGKDLYYSRKFRNSNAGTIFKMNLVNGKTKEIYSGKAYELVSCDGKYIYSMTPFSNPRNVLYRYTVKGKKIKKVASNFNGISSGDKHLLLYGMTFEEKNKPIYSVKMRTASKKKIASGIGASIYKNKVYYMKKQKDGKVKVCSCNFNGKNKKALTKAVKYYGEIPEKYRRIMGIKW